MKYINRYLDNSIVTLACAVSLEEAEALQQVYLRRDDDGADYYIEDFCAARFAE